MYLPESVSPPTDLTPATLACLYISNYASIGVRVVARQFEQQRHDGIATEEQI